MFQISLRHSSEREALCGLKLYFAVSDISEVTKLCTLQLTNISLYTWMSSEALQIVKKVDSLAFDQQFRLRNFD